MNTRAPRKFTIVIPTRERADTLVYAIDSALAQDYDNFEILVSDNASDDNTAEIVAKYNDPRVHYVNTGERVSMSHNWEFALSHVTDGWVTVLGDDDAILPGALLAVNKLVDATGVQAVRSNGCGYSWPGLLGERHGMLILSLRTGYRRINCKKALIKVLNGELHYNNLPVLYNGGFVDSALIRQAKSVTGDFFRSMTPDVYSAIVFSHLVEEYVYSEEPFAINGASQHSGGTAGFEKVKRKRSYDPAKKFYSENNIPFHPKLPLIDNQRPVQSIQAIIYEAYLQAEPFHGKGKLPVSDESQLEIILRNSSTHKEEVRVWGAEFARHNNLDYDRVLARSANPGKRLYVNFRKVINKAGKLISSITIFGNPNVPLTNVFQACIAAGTLKVIRPGLFERVVNVFERLRRYLKAR